MLFSEYTDLAEPAGLPLTCLAHEVAEAIYGVMPAGGHDGHVQTVAWAKKNRAAFEAMVAALQAKTDEWKALAESQGEAVRSRQRRIDELEHQLVCERFAAAAATEQARSTIVLMEDQLTGVRDDLRQIREQRDDAWQAADDLAVVKKAFRILSDGTGQ